MFTGFRTLNVREISLLSRVWSGPVKELSGKQAEEKMTNLLREKLPQAKCIEVTDISGGCGAMFEVHVTAQEFKGLNVVKQHKLITEILKNEIKDMHGIRIFTTVPSS